MTQTSAAGLFAGIKDAKASFAANYEKPGHYVERIDRLKTGVTRNKEDFLAVEKTVLVVLDDAEGKGHREGESITHMMMAKHDSFLGNVKAMVKALLDVPEEEISEEVCVELCAESQPLSGMIIECENIDILTRKNQPFTRVTYKREVPASELVDMISEKMLTLHFEGGALLERMIEAEGDG